MSKTPLASATSNNLIQDLKGLIEQARQYVSSTANSTLTMLYWKMGERIRKEVLLNQRASYGEEILPTLSAKLEPEYGTGFSVRSLARMIKFAEVFPDEKIVVSLIRQLGWSHFIELIPLKQPLEREYYAEMCRIERWSVRTLRERIGSQLYLRSALAKNPEDVIASEINHLRDGGQMTPDMVFRDPYMLDFLGLPDGYSERDLETAILRDMERFLLEMGSGFTFVARQKRVSVGASADSEQVELMDLGASNIRVAQYWDHMPDVQVLQAQLHRAVQLARERVVNAQVSAT